MIDVAAGTLVAQRSNVHFRCLSGDSLYCSRETCQQSCYTSSNRRAPLRTALRAACSGKGTGMNPGESASERILHQCAGSKPRTLKNVGRKNLLVVTIFSPTSELTTLAQSC
jgi:hypothetical protein